MIQFKEKIPKILYIQGFPGHWEKELGGKGYTYGYLEESGYNPIFTKINYEKEDPDVIFNRLQKIVSEEKVDIVIGHSTGGLFASKLKNVIRVLLNPAFDIGTYLLFKPNIPLRISFRLREMKNEIIPTKNNTIGIFSKVDKVADSKEDYLKIFGKTNFFEIDAPHSPKSGEWNNQINPYLSKKLGLTLNKIKNSVSYTPNYDKRTYAFVDGIRLPGLKNFPTILFKIGMVRKERN